MDTPITELNPIRISEKLRPQLVRLSKNMLIYGVGGFLNRFIGFLLLPVFTSYLTPVDYGISSILSWVAFILTPVFSLGLGAAIAPCYFEDNSFERKRNTLWTAFTLLMISSSGLAIMGAVFAETFSLLALKTSEYHELILLSLLSTCLSILSTPWTLYLQFEERAKLFVTITMLVTLGSIGSSLILVVVFGRGIRGWVEAGLIGQVINLVLVLLPAVVKMGVRFNFSLSKDLLKLSVPLIPSFAFLFLLQHGNRYIIQWFDGLDTLGIYTLGFNFGLVMSLAVSAFQAAWLPFFMSFVDKHEEAAFVFGRVLTYYVLAFGALTTVFFVFAKPIVILFTQPAFHEGYKVVGLSASSQFFAGVFYILLPGLYFAKEVAYVSLIQGVASVIAMGLNFLLIPSFGLSGAGICVALGFLVMILLTHLWNFNRRARYLSIKYEWMRVGVLGLVYSVYAVLMLWDRKLNWVEESIFSISMMLTMPLVLFCLLRPQERRFVKSFLPAVTKRAVSKSA